ncbi:alpha/beta fold hydrolase [Marinimicrococcus flavescens]|uniref:Alpha/beta fold hydrolase n=1 Tax=Marinimicrococcus flavescens TaxID=3031815 RepID=A0AAP3UYZ9_9PROT|nr:alpha/beta fold hydrolase [Marinimicrococcus flavescens]
MPPHLAAESLVARDGTRLPLRRWQPAGAPRTLLLALHSFGDYSAAFETLGRYLAASGHAVYAIDQRGFGAAPGFGRWAGTAAMREDLVDFVRAVRAGQPGIPLHVLGESMGGSVALVAAGEGLLPEVESLVLVGPGVREGIRLRYLWNALYGLASLVAPGLSRGIEPADPAYTKRAFARFASDPLVLREVRAGTYYGLLRLADAASTEAYQVALPAALLIGADDTYVGARSFCLLAAALPRLEASRAYEGGIHRLLHQETVQPRLLADIRSWLEEGRLGKGAPGDEALPAFCRGAPGPA